MLGHGLFEISVIAANVAGFNWAGPMTLYVNLGPLATK
jgi:hypothetical protein